MQPAACASLKSRGVRVMVLNTEYQYMDLSMPGVIEDGSQLIQTNAALPNIPSAMETCASPGMYFQADLPQEIANAMQQMFGASVESLRLTQ